MGLSNLPPGCRDSDIPGNRTIDQAFDYFLEHKEEELKGKTQEEIEKEFKTWFIMVQCGLQEFNDHYD